MDGRCNRLVTSAAVHLPKARNARDRQQGNPAQGEQHRNDLERAA
jgi:hypothetical protein